MEGSKGREVACKQASKQEKASKEGASKGRTTMAVDATIYCRIEPFFKWTAEDFEGL